jgi:hypothetical protein
MYENRSKNQSVFSLAGKRASTKFREYKNIKGGKSSYILNCSGKLYDFKG